MHDRLTLSFSERNVEVEIASPTLSKRFDSVDTPFTHFTARPALTVNRRQACAWPVAPASTGHATRPGP
jgi:hypothetical protein